MLRELLMLRELVFLGISEELLLHVKRSLKDLIYKKFLFTIVKKNLLILKMNKKQINK